METPLAPRGHWNKARGLVVNGGETETRGEDCAIERMAWERVLETWRWLDAPQAE